MYDYCFIDWSMHSFSCKSAFNPFLIRYLGLKRIRVEVFPHKILRFAANQQTAVRQAGDESESENKEVGHLIIFFSNFIKQVPLQSTGRKLVGSRCKHDSSLSCGRDTGCGFNHRGSWAGLSPCQRYFSGCLLERNKKPEEKLLLDVAEKNNSPGGSRPPPGPGPAREETAAPPAPTSHPPGPVKPSGSSQERVSLVSGGSDDRNQWRAALHLSARHVYQSARLQLLA